MKRCKSCGVPLPPAYKGSICGLCGYQTAGEALFIHPMQVDLSVQKQEAELIMQQKIRARNKPEAELPLFNKQRELF
jgi:uncharacterized Zn finger protein (UPF0148 family)